MRRCEQCRGQMLSQRYSEFFERGTRWTCLLCATEVEEADGDSRDARILRARRENRLAPR